MTRPRTAVRRQPAPDPLPVSRPGLPAPADRGGPGVGAVTPPGPAARPAGHGFTASVCREPGAFAALAGEWESLRGRCATATPFQSHAWLSSWWRSYGRPRSLRVVLVRRDGALVAAAPLMRVRRPLPVLLPVGAGISDLHDVLVDDGCPQAAGELVRALRAAARGAVVDLREVAPGAAAEQLYRLWPGARRERTDSVCLELPALPMAGLLERLPGPAAKRSRRKLRRVEALGIRERAVPPGEVPAAVRRMLRLHARQWEGRGVTPEHLRARFAAHLSRAVAAMAADGDATVTEYLLDGRVVACDVALLSADAVCGYLYGSDPVLRERHVDITTMLLRHDARFAATSGRGTLSLLRGTEPHKARWRPRAVVNRRLLLAGAGAAPGLRLYALGVAGRSLAADLLGPVAGVPLGAARAALAGAVARAAQAAGPG